MRTNAQEKSFFGCNLAVLLRFSHDLHVRAEDFGAMFEPREAFGVRSGLWLG